MPSARSSGSSLVSPGDTSPSIIDTSERSSETSAASNRATTPPPLPGENPELTGTSSRGLLDRIRLERRPQAVGVENLHIAFHLFARAAGHDRLALVVYVQHELLGLLLGVAEDRLENVGHVGHQVDRVVPDDGYPWQIGPDVR